MKTCIGCRINRIVWPKVDTALMKHGPCYMPSQVLGDLNEHKDVQRFCSCGCRQDANSFALPEFEMPLRRHFILSPQLYSNTPRGTPHGKHPISSQKKKMAMRKGQILHWLSSVCPSWIRCSLNDVTFPDSISHIFYFVQAWKQSRSIHWISTPNISRFRQIRRSWPTSKYALMRLLLLNSTTDRHLIVFSDDSVPPAVPAYYKGLQPFKASCVHVRTWKSRPRDLLPCRGTNRVISE